MNIHRVPFNEVDQFSKRDIAFQLEDEQLRPFYKYPVNIESFDQAIKNKSTQKIDRNLLVSELRKQYTDINCSASVKENINLLFLDNSFTIITAHQPILFTGPLYYIYKISSAINLCRTLKETYPLYNFIPVFVSGGEDHDFDEINHMYIFDKKIEWDKSSDDKPVGRLDTDGLIACLDQLEAFFRDESEAFKITKKARAALSHSKTYGEFVFQLVNSIFSDYGLIYLDMDNPAFKKAFTPQIKAEVLQNVSKDHVLEQQAALEELGYDYQAYARDINFFYIDEDGSRKRIEKTEDGYSILNSTLSFTHSEMEQLIEAKPESFSPNVIMRPLYQEFIMPNLAYIGGGGELAYWMERHSQFAHFNIPFPMIIRRNSVLLLDKASQRNLGKLGLNHNDILQRVDLLVNDYLAKASGDEFNLSAYNDQIEETFGSIIEKTRELDPTLVARVEAEKNKAQKSVSQIEAKLKKVVKSKSEIAVNKIHKIYGSVYPDGKLQERRSNIVEFVDKAGYGLIDELVQHLDPLDKNFLIIELD